MKSSFSYFSKRPNYYIVLVLDCLLIAVAHVLAYLIRFEGSIPAEHLGNMWTLLPCIAAGKIIVFHFFKLYRGMWRYTGLVDLLNILKAGVVSSLILVVIIALLTRFHGFSRSVFILDGVLTIAFVAGLRVGIRYYLLYAQDLPMFQGLDENGVKNILIAGAGAAGEQVLRQVGGNGRRGTRVVGFVDDDRNKWGRMIHGVSVIGRVDKIPQIVEDQDVDEILIAMPSASGAQMREVIEVCKAAKVPFKTLPGIRQLIDGKVSLKTIRDVAYEDLLRRPEVRLDDQRMAEFLHRKRVLVTGAGGSIGSELCRQISRFNPANLIIFDAVEKNLFDLENELKRDYDYLNFKSALGNVLDSALMRNIFKDYRPEVVFHAAAFKHVPIVELNPWEGVENNIIGTRGVLDLSVEYGAEYFILVSSDKAVRPSSVMGATKRVGEMLVESHNHGPTNCLAVRFGNVVGSSGSVVPFFQRQIARGGPVTVTHADVCRYFMTVSEAAQLILQAGSMGEGGEIFILEMGEPVKIVDLVRDLVSLSGLDPDRDIEIEFIGLRPGEKLYEELITEGEGIVPTPHNRIMVLRGADFDKKPLYRQLDELIAVARTFDPDRIKAKLKEIVPEYMPPGD